MAEIQDSKIEKTSERTEAKAVDVGQSIDVGLHNIETSKLFNAAKPFVIDTLRQDVMTEAIASQLTPAAVMVGAGISPVIAPTLASNVASALENSGLDPKVTAALKSELEKRGDKLPKTDEGLRELARETADAVMKSRDRELALLAKNVAQEVLASQKSDTRERNFAEALQDTIYYGLKKFAGENVNPPSTTRPNTGRSTSKNGNESEPAVTKTESKPVEEAGTSRSAKKDEEPQIVLVAESTAETSKKKETNETVAA